MPKLKKATNKKALPKKALSTAKIPKATPSKAAKPKPPKKKTALAKASKPATKPSKAKQEDAVLHQAFVNSLVKLQDFWQKKCVNLKKEVDVLGAKYDKTTSKQKEAKNNLASLAKALKANPGKVAHNKHQKAERTYEEASQQASLAQATMNQAKEILASAKQAVNKYAALSKAIAQFESEWLKNLANDTPGTNETENKPSKTLTKITPPPLQSKVKTVKIDLDDLDEDLDTHEEDLLIEDEAIEEHDDLFVSLENEFYPEDEIEEYRKA